MSTQPITDYMTKQIFIENNIVTYRSLSRHLGIHVNAAKNELATYHHNAPYHSQTCVATFLLSGTPRSNTQRKASQNTDEDYNMDSTQDTREDSDDGDEVPQTSIAIVNEKDLEDAKATFEEIHSIHVYSLSPAPLLDAGLLCAPTEFVRNTDKANGTDFMTKMGHIVGEGIKVGAGKKKVQPSAPVAGPSKSKPSVAPEPKPIVKSETKEKLSAAMENPKATGKFNFFKQPEKTKDTKEVKKIKQEEPAPEAAKRMFFSKPPAKVPANEPTKPPPVKAPLSKAPSPAPSVSSTKDEKEIPVQRGVKRKSSVGLEVREKSPENRANSVKAAKGNTRRRKVVLSDDEEDNAPVKLAPRRSRLSYRTESGENSATEGDVHLLMDIDDDEVEKVSRVPSTNASSNEHDDDDDDDNESSRALDEDVHMTDDTSIKLKVVKRKKPKTVIPVGRNGLKKRKVTKTRRSKDANGYLVKEDYSDWESVNSGAEPEPPVATKAKPKPKPKVVVVKKEEETQDLPPPAKEEKEAPPKKAPSKAAATTKSKAGPKTGGPKTQKGLMMNFFGPKKT